MKPKQLANVLVKILGLSLCAHSIPSLLGVVVSGISLLLQTMYDGGSNSMNRPFYMGYSPVYWLSPVVEVAIGIYLLARSRQLVEKLFKDEAE
jgi:hypothetical protein